MESKSKPGIMKLYGEEVVNAFKVGYKGRPPPMQPSHPYWHANERKYEDLDPSQIPLTESLEDCMIRAKVLYDKKIKADIQMGKNVLVVAHANSLRGLIKHLEKLDDEEICDVGIPNGIPLVYDFDGAMKIVPRAKAIPPLRGGSDIQHFLKVCYDNLLHFRRVFGTEGAIQGSAEKRERA